MEYPYLSTEFRENLDKETTEIINCYWKMDNGVFINTPTDLRNELNITQPKLNSIVKSNSETNLYVDECVECKSPIIIPVTSQSTAKTRIENTYYQCEKCRTELLTKIKEVDYLSKKQHKLEYALKVRIWNKLTKEELAVLKKVIEYSDYKTLRNKFIQQNPQHYWQIFEKLDRLSLIDIQREPIHEKYIEKIYYLPELANELETNPRSNVTVESGLNFHLPKRLNRIKETQPNFSQRIIFDKDIVIEKGTEYICSVWEKSDGSINFGMKPTSELNAQKDGIKDFEPKSVGEIISKIWE